MMFLPQTPHFALTAKLGLDLAAMTTRVRCEIAQRIAAAPDNHGAATLMQQAVLDHGGTLIEPTPKWGPLEFHVNVLGCSGTGETVAAAASDWATCALRMGEQPCAS
ncbi:hypothetical protein ACJ5NV_20305 [Loktanella agnita]|uniref:hypothetical protein n=1 Tax=Loktanella agnita TaxID=287097 RepID=UPI003988B24E